MMKENNFYISGLLKLEQLKQYYINKCRQKRAIESMLQTHTNSINTVKRLFEPKYVFEVEPAFATFIRSYNIDLKRSELIVAIQEAQQRLLSCIVVNREVNQQKRAINNCIDLGESVNKYLRTELDKIMMQEHNRFMKEGNHDEAMKVLQYMEDIDTIADIITELCL